MKVARKARWWHQGKWMHALPFPPTLPTFSGNLFPALFLMAGLTVVAVGCPRGSQARFPLLTSDDPQAEAALADARKAEEEGRADEAVGLYQRFLIQYPKDPLVAMAHLHLGRIAVERGENAVAREHLAPVIQHPDRAVAERALFFDGIALHRGGESAKALEQLTPLVGRTIAPEDTALLLETIAQAALAVGDAFRAIRALDALIGSGAPPHRKDQAQLLAAQLVSQEITPTQCDRLVDFLDRDGPIWPIAAKRALP
ncbi:MAG: hypothetical protein KC416_15750, partial [Myxococcales bacterium]|nr:hypothetical protein [Myxococcales bacterium]